MSSYLIHHGIKGQKWGVRRYQNKDGSRTPQGRNRRSDKKSLGKVFVEGVFSKPYKNKSASTWPPTEIGSAMLSRWPKTAQIDWKAAYNKSQVAMRWGDKKQANYWAGKANDIVIQQQTAQFYGMSYSDILAKNKRR